MHDISEFAKRAAKLFSDSQQSARWDFKLDLPKAAVEEFVKAVCFASMIADEGRYPMVSIMGYRADFGKQLNFRFAEEEDSPPTANNIAKLAHAVAPGSHLCVLSSQGRLLLGGIHVTMLDELRQYGYGWPSVANPLKLVVRGPGHIEMSSCSIALVYNAGEIREEIPLQDCDMMNLLADSVAAELADETTGAIESLEEIFSDIIEAIRRLGHGGMLLVNKCRDLKLFSACRQLECRLLHDLLIRYWSDVKKLRAESGGLVHPLLWQDQRMASPEKLTVASDVTMLENCVRSIGHLAGMDGAIVMDYRCNVVAFNAFISELGKGMDQTNPVDPISSKMPGSKNGGSRGSRHQSAESYVRRVPHSFAFVISQDGGVSAYHNWGDGTVVCKSEPQKLE